MTLPSTASNAHSPRKEDNLHHRRQESRIRRGRPTQNMNTRRGYGGVARWL